MNLTDLLDGVQCPRCGRENTYVKRDIERVAQVDGNTVTVTITVGECTFCGEQLLDDAATRRLEEAVEKIRSGVIGGLTATGTAYHYP
ncbi:MAG TPA: YgiT-type zinc finger protein [Ktedonobacterales bacterium]